jgi:hypothetical protein
MCVLKLHRKATIRKIPGQAQFTLASSACHRRLLNGIVVAAGDSGHQLLRAAGQRQPNRDVCA